jgi:CBS domain-containing protein
MPAISELMTRDVRTVSPDTSLQQAAQLLQELDIGSLPVCNGQRLLGMVTDRDMTVRGTAAGLPPQSTPVKEVMTESIAYCLETDSVDDVMRKMGDRQLRRIPVIDGERNLVGIVALGDLATNRARNTDKVLRKISEPSGAGS